MQPRARDTQARRRVRSVVCEVAFPSAHPLPSIPSAGGHRSHTPRQAPLGCIRRFHLRARLGLPWLHAPAPPPFVRELRQYYGAVRLPDPYIGGVHLSASHRGPFGRSQGLPVLAHDASTHARGLSVRPRQVPPHLAFLGASSVAFSSGNSLGTWEFNSISRLNTRPTCAPVNASEMPSRASPHDSGSSWVASPSTCESLLRCIMPVYPGASSGTSNRW